MTPPAPVYGWGRGRWLAASAMLLVAGYLARYEVGRIVGGVQVRGVSHAAGDLSGVTRLGSAGAALLAWSQAACTGVGVRGWLLAGVLFSVPALLGFLGVQLAADARWNLGIRGWSLFASAAQGAVLVLETVAIMAIPTATTAAACAPGRPIMPVASGVRITLGIAIVLRWSILLVIAVRVAFSTFRRIRSDRGRARSLTVLRAIGLQRFLLIVLGALSAMLLLPGQEVLNQGVDVERSWLLTDDPWTGARYLVLAVAGMTVLSLVLRYLADVHVAPRRLVEVPLPAVVARAVVELPRHDGGLVRVIARRVRWWTVAFVATLLSSWRWLAVAATIPVGCAVFSGIGILRVYWTGVTVACAILFGVPVLSAAFACVPTVRELAADEPEVRALAWKLGRLFAGLVVPVLLLSAVRAYVAPLLLDYHPGVDLVVVIVGTAGACAIPFWVLSTGAEPRLVAAPGPTGTPAADALQSDRRKVLDPQHVGAPSGPAETLGQSPPGLVISVLPSVLIGGIGMVVLGGIPAAVARMVGVLGSVALCLGALSAFYAALVIAAQMLSPPHLFRILAMRRTPVIGLVLLVVVGSTLFNTGTSLHAVRAPQHVTAADRPTLLQSFARWQAAQPCAQPIGTLPDGRTVQVEPMLFVATEGGGIRAAWWTVDTLSTVVSTTCGRRSLFLASGVSGGSVGLAVFDTSPHPYRDMTTLADQDALAGATDGLLSRDLVASGFGVLLRSADGPDGDPFPDRAALMEQAWERGSPGLATPFPSGTVSLPWRTVFNGTSVGHHCRVLISDLAPGPDTSSCADQRNPVPGSYDLFGDAPCLNGIRIGSAALMTGRFPYVTPSAVVPDCATGGFADQVIDGGYSENSGISTINDLLVQLMPAVRATNAAHLADRVVTVVLPLVVFLHNRVTASAGGSLPPPPASASPELIVPLANLLSGGSVLSATATLLAGSQDVTADYLDATAAAPVRQIIDARFGSRTMTVAPQQTAQVALPLGWSLSQATRHSLDSAFDAYLSCQPSGERTCSESAEFDGLVRSWGTAMQFPPP